MKRVSIGTGGTLGPPAAAVGPRARRLERAGFDMITWPDHLMAGLPESLWTPDISPLAAMSPSKSPHVFRDSVRESSMILMIIAAAALFSYMMSLLYVSQSAAEWLVSLKLNKWVLLFYINVFLLILGAILDIFSATVLIVPLLLPIAAQYVAEALPLTHFLRLVRGIMLRGADLMELWPSLAALGAFIAVMLVVAVSRVRKRLD